MRDFCRANPMIVLLLPLVAAILFWRYLFPPSALPEEPGVYAFVVESGPKSTVRCERFDTRLIAVWDSTRWISAEGSVHLYLLRDSTRVLPQYGDTVWVRTTPEWFHRSGRAFASSWRIVPARVHEIPLQIRLYRRLQEAGLSGDELATIGALTLGYKEDLDPDVKRHFQASGAAHVLAVSGLHTGILYGIVLALLTLGGRVRPRYENQLGRIAMGTVVIVVMWVYARLTGMTPSVVRAVLMVSMVEIGRMIYRNSLTLNMIAAAAVLILLVRPADLWSVSFQLSFAATFSIVFFAREAERYFSRKAWREHWYGRLCSWIIGTIIVSIAAQLGTLPITMYYFGQISNYFLLTNLIVLPLASLLVPCGLITIALGGSWCGVLIGKVSYGLAWILNHSVEWIEGLPGSTTSVSIGSGMVVIYYLILVIFCFFFAKRD